MRGQKLSSTPGALVCHAVPLIVSRGFAVLALAVLPRSDSVPPHVPLHVWHVALARCCHFATTPAFLWLLVRALAVQLGFDAALLHWRSLQPCAFLLPIAPILHVMFPIGPCCLTFATGTPVLPRYAPRSVTIFPQRAGQYS